ncbi:MAG TPA: Ig-like domain-containing protein [Longimicrobiales bacterium]
MSRWTAVLKTDKQPAATILRVALGAIMLPHGAQHALGWFGGYGFSGTLSWMSETLGFPAALAGLAIITELLAPIALILGIGGRVAALGIIGIMAGAMLTHLPNGFFMNWFGSLPAGSEGFEYHLMVMAAALTIVIQGSGAFSLDRVLLNQAPRIRKQAFTSLGLMLLSLLLIACSDEQVNGPVGQQPVAAVSIQPDTLTLLVNQTRVLQARVIGMDGNVVHDRTVSWTADDQLIATVSSSGVITARRPGEVTITASTGGKSGSATLRVIQPVPAVARVEVRPGTVALEVGESQQLSVHLFTANNTELPAPPVGEVQWSSSNPGSVAVDGSGKVIALTGGDVTISAKFANVTGTARVVVPSFTEYHLIDMPIKVREYELPATPNFRLFRTLLLTASDFRLSTDERAYQQRFSVEVWETQRFMDGSSITSFIETVTTDDFGAAGHIAGVGDFVFHSQRNGATFTGRRSGTSFELEQSVPGGIEEFVLKFIKN